MALNLTGDVELSRKFAALKGKDGKAAFRKGCRAGAKLVAKRIRETAPQKSGAMARSVKVRALKRSKTRVGVRIEVKAVNARGVPYAWFIERGTKRHPGKRVRKKSNPARYNALAWRIEPRLFVEKAAESVGVEAISVAHSAMADEIEKRATKGVVASVGGGE